MKSNMNNMNIPLFIFIIKKGMYHNRQIYQDLILILYRTIFFLKEFEIFLIIT